MIGRHTGCNIISMFPTLLSCFLIARPQQLRATANTPPRRAKPPRVASAGCCTRNHHRVEIAPRKTAEAGDERLGGMALLRVGCHCPEGWLARPGGQLVVSKSVKAYL